MYDSSHCRTLNEIDSHKHCNLLCKPFTCLLLQSIFLAIGVCCGDSRNKRTYTWFVLFVCIMIFIHVISHNWHFMIYINVAWILARNYWFSRSFSLQSEVIVVSFLVSEITVRSFLIIVHCILHLLSCYQIQFFLRYSAVELNRNVVNIVCSWCHLLVCSRFHKYVLWWTI